MREIKIRVWDKFEEKMIYNKELTDGDGYYLYYCYFGKDGLMIGKTGPSGDGIDLDCIMQYIGIKDRVGQEIYEGDLVEFTREIDDKVINDFGIVEFVNGSFTIFNGYCRFYNIVEMELEVKGNKFTNKNQYRQILDEV